MTSKSETLAAALTEVRRAYRLLFAYQRRVADLFADVNKALVAEGFKFECWNPNTFLPVPRRTDAFFEAGRSPWAMLPGFRPRAYWKRGGSEWVDLTAMTDDGYDWGDDADAADVISVEQTSCKLYPARYRANAAVTDWPLNEIEAHERYDGRPWRVEHDGIAYECACPTVDLADLVDDAALAERVVAPLVRWARAPESLAADAGRAGAPRVAARERAQRADSPSRRPR